MTQSTTRLFDLSGQVAVVTGGSGALGGAIAFGLAQAGADVAVLARRPDAIKRVVAEIQQAQGAGQKGGQKAGQQAGPDGDIVEDAALGVTADVLDPASLLRARDEVLDRWGRLDILVNAAGGNRPSATVAPGASFFGLDPQAVREVVDLNLMGTFLPTQVMGEAMAAAGRGSIINISSMTASHPLSRVVGYGAAKAAVENLTRWLADHMARTAGPAVRVNAIAPGFFLADQNRSLLTNDDGSLTPRGEAVVGRTPMGRFGDPAELVGTVVWLASSASSFVSGAVVPVDGGFSAVAGI